MTTFNWEITKLEVYPTSEGKTDMVLNVHWRCDGMKTVGEDVYKSVYIGVTYVPYDPDHHWVEYSELTPVEVLEWVWENGVDQASVEAAVQQSIDNEINPPVITPALPWVK